MNKPTIKQRMEDLNTRIDDVNDAIEGIMEEIDDLLCDRFNTWDREHGWMTATKMELIVLDRLRTMLKKGTRDVSFTCSNCYTTTRAVFEYEIFQYDGKGYDSEMYPRTVWRCESCIKQDFKNGYKIERVSGPSWDWETLPDTPETQWAKKGDRVRDDYYRTGTVVKINHALSIPTALIQFDEMPDVPRYIRIDRIRKIDEFGKVTG